MPPKQGDCPGCHVLRQTVPAPLRLVWINHVVARRDADDQVVPTIRADGPGNIGADRYAFVVYRPFVTGPERRRHEEMFTLGMPLRPCEEILPLRVPRASLVRSVSRSSLHNLDGTRFGALVVNELHRPGALLHIHTLESALGIRGVGIPVQIHASQYHDLNAAKRRAAAIRHPSFQEVENPS